MKTSKFTPKLRERAVRMVLEHRADHSSGHLEKRSNLERGGD